MNKNDFKVIAFLAYKNIVKSKSTFFVIVAVMAMSFLSITFFAAIIDGLGYEFEEGMNSYGEDKMSWKEILFIIPLVPALVYSLVYLYIMDFLLGDIK